MATLEDVRRLGYEVNVMPGPIEGMTIASVTGFGMYNNQTRCKADGTGWDGNDQEALDSWADPAAHTERKFQAEHPDWHAARSAIQQKGYIVERPDPSQDVFTIRAEGFKREGVTGDEFAALAASLGRSLHRTFKQSPRFVEVDVPDWQLVAKVEELLRPYVLPGSELEFRAHDQRGTFTAGTLDVFRQELEARDEQPEWILLSTDTMEPQGGTRSLQVYMKPGFSRGELASGDEIIVNGLAKRLSDLFEAASKRRSISSGVARQDDEVESGYAGERMARIYRKTYSGAYQTDAIEVLPVVDVPDWQLIERIDELFRRYLTAEGFMSFAAEDRHGSLKERDLEAFRRAVEAMDVPPDRVSVGLFSGSSADPERAFSIVMAESDLWRQGSLTSTDQAVIDHLTLRLRELFAQANERRQNREPAESEAEAEAEAEAEPERSVQPSDAAMPVRNAGPIVRFLRDTSVEAVGGLVVVILVAVWALFFR